MKKKRKYLLLVIILIILASWIYCHSCRPVGKISEPNIKLYLSGSDTVVALKLEEYIEGTVAAEMPASFDMEALKAQAVCARTYTFHRLWEQASYPRGADLSDDINSCQAYISWPEFAKRHPYHTDVYSQKIKQAVRETRGIIMLYQGQPLDALYHSTCGGRTEGSANAPYLKTAACDYCKNSSHYSETFVYTQQELQQKLGIGDGASNPRVTVLDRSSSGRVLKLSINGRTYSGEEFRRLMNMPSTWWNFEIKAGKLLIHSRGYGHGLGLCQFGANGMAVAGYGVEEILNHYYQGFKLFRMNY